jgi:Arc/MetJ-type ribon-helix-helix transcriptional regulator
MEIHLTDDLQQFVRDQVRQGRFTSEDQVVIEALARFKAAAPPAPPAGDPILGTMRDDAPLLDQIVADAMEARRSRPWRTAPVE